MRATWKNVNMAKAKMYQLLGAALMVASMVLIPFWFSPHDEIRIGAEIWALSMMGIFYVVPYPHLGLIAAFLSAALNIPQLVLPFWNNPRAGTSRFFVVTFCAVAFVVLPLLVMYIQINHSNNEYIYREGYILYQAGYILSAIGFLKMRKLLQDRIPLEEEAKEL